MEKIHSHTNCPACTTRLSGEENHCPFCGYRLVFENKNEPVLIVEETPEITTEEKENIIDNSELQIKTVLSCDNSNEPEDFGASEIEITDIENFDNKSQEEDISEYSINNLFNSENSESEKQSINIEEKDENNTKPVNEEISLLNDDEAEIEEKKHKRNKLFVSIILVLIVALIGLGTATILHYYNKVNVFFLPEIKKNNSELSKQAISIERNYYFCYSTWKLNKRNIVAFSKIFKLEEKGNNETIAEKKYTDTFLKSYPDALNKQTTTITKKFSNPVSAYKEKNKLLNNYLKEKYSFRFIEIK